MTESYLEAYAYKRFKNADVIYTKPVGLDEKYIDDKNLKTNMNVRPSVLKPEVGSKVIDAMQDAKSSIYFKGDVVTPPNRKDGFSSDFEWSSDGLGTIDWPSVNLERDDKNGLSTNVKKLVKNDGISPKALLDTDVIGRDRVNHAPNSYKHGIISAMENRNVVDVSDAINKMYSGELKDDGRELDFIKANDDWYAVTSNERLVEDWSPDSKLDIAKVSDLNQEVQDALQPKFAEAEAKMGSNAVVGHQSITEGKIERAYESDWTLNWMDVEQANDFRLMMTDAKLPNGEPAKINESIMQAAKETEDVRATQLTELAEFEEYAEESLSSHLDDDDLDLLP